MGDDTMAFSILRGGYVLDIAAGTAEPADILVEDDTIREIGPPGCPAPADAVEIAAAHRLLHPGLVNAHTHGHGNLAKGMGDRSTLQLLFGAARLVLRARPGASRGRADDTASLFLRFHPRLRRSGPRVRPRRPQPRRRIQSAGGHRDPALRPDTDRPSRQPRRARAALHGRP